MDEKQKAALIKEAEAEAAAYLKGTTPTADTVAGTEQGEGYKLPPEVAAAYAKNRAMEEERAASETKPSSFMLSPETAALVGAGLGAYAQHTGRTLGNGLLRPGEGVYSSSAPPVAPPAVAPTAPAAPAGPSLVDTHIAQVTEQQRLLDEAINTKLRQITGDPKANYTGFSPEQVDRLFSGGNSDTLNTPGVSREFTHNDETSRKADVTSLNKERLGSVGLDSRVAVEQAGPMVTLAGSRISVPPQTAIDLHNAAQAKANEEYAPLHQEYKRQSAINKATLEALNAKKQADTAAAERSAAAKAVADENAAIRARSAAERSQRNAGLRAGAGKVALGALGGLETGAQAVNMYNNYRAGVNPDLTEKLSLAGGLASMFGNRPFGIAGQVAQIPYAISKGNLGGAAANAAVSALPIPVQLGMYTPKASAPTVTSESYPPEIKTNLSRMAKALSPEDYARMRASYLTNVSRYGQTPTDEEKLLGVIRSGQRGGVDPSTLLPN